MRKNLEFKCERRQTKTKLRPFVRIIAERAQVHSLCILECDIFSQTLSRLWTVAVD